MAKRKFTVILIPDEDGYQAFVPHYPEITTWGQTPQEAFNHAKELLEDALQEDAKVGHELPPVTPAKYVIVGNIEANVPDKLIKATEKWLSKVD